MDFLIQLSDDETYDNPLSILLDIAISEFSDVKLAMINAHNLSPEKFQITDFCDQSYCPVYSAEEMLNGGPTFPIRNGKFIEAWKNLTLPIKISLTSCSTLLDLELESYEEAIVIPIWMKGKVIRWLVLVEYKRNVEDLDLTRLSLLMNYALTNILRTEQKRQLDKARQWIDKELSDISRIQSLLLPHKELKIEGIQIAFKFKAYREAGGDYLELAKLPNLDNDEKVIRWGGGIADVTGHGPSAAVEAAMFDAILRTFPAQTDSTPADVAKYTNKNFFTRRDRGKFITALFFAYRSDTKLLRYVSAGHPNGYIKRGNEVIMLDQSLGIPIGVLPDYEWEFKEFYMKSGDIFFMYTDVVLETRNQNNEEFGAKRLFHTIQQSPNCPHKLVDQVESTLLNFAGSKQLMDDLTISAIKLD